MEGTASADGREGRAYSEKVQPKTEAIKSCSFCWFVLAVYPALKGMTAKDTDTYREHLTKVHGLQQDISP